MFKTSRAYFCQTVAEGSPLNRITPKLFGQARQSFEALFRRQGRADGFLSKQPAVKQYGGGRASNGGVFAQIHANSRGLLTKFAEKNQTSELVNAMRHRYGWTGAFRSGMWGQKLSTFAFVGIGVAAGAQWNVFDERNLQDQLPDIMELFGKCRERNIQTRINSEEPPTLPADFELDMPLSLTEGESSEQSFIVLSNLTFDEDNVSMPEDESLSEEGEERFEAVDDYYITQADHFPVNTSDIRDEIEEQRLMECLSVTLRQVEEQHAQLPSLRASVTQLSDLLHDIVGPSTDEELSFENIEPSLQDIGPLLADSDGGELRDRLVRTLSVAGEQQLQLSALKQQLLQLNQQLCDISAATMRPIIIRSSFSKRDACCGPGSDEL